MKAITHTRCRAQIGLLIVSTSLSLLPSPAFGQSAAQPGTSPVSPNPDPAVRTPPVSDQTRSDGASDGDIVVTALKRSQSLTTVPASISALDERALAARGVATLNDIQLQTPSLSIGTALGTTQVSIRGVGLTIATGAGEPGVAVHLDGVYEGRPALSNLAQFDLQRVEVLRGPQGTLYGRNATGGAINFISNPATNTFEGGMKIGYAEYNEFHGELVASGPVADGVRARFGLTYTNRATGFIRNISPGQNRLDAIENIGARTKLSFDLSPRAVLDLQLTYLHQTGSPVYLTPTRTLNPDTVAVNPALQTALATISPRETAIDTSILNRTAYSPVATLKWDLGPVKLTSITAYQDIDNQQLTDADGTSAQIGVLPSAYRSRQFTQELNLSGSGNTLDYVVGGYFLHERYRAYQDVIYPNGYTLAFPVPGVGTIPIPVFAPGNQTYQHWSENRKAYAGFGDATLHLTGRLSLFAGARYSRDTLTLIQSVGTQPFPLTCTNLRSEVAFNAFTPRGGVQFAPNDGGNLYASVSRGYKSGGLNFGTCNDPYEPEKLTSYEVGYKTRLFGNTLTVGVAGYYYDYRNLQVFQLKPISEGGGSFIDNAPKATIKGIEGDFNWSPVKAFQINGALSFLDAKYDEYTNTDSSVIGSAPINLAGRTITKSPKFTGNIGAQFTSPDVGGLGHFTLRGEAYHSASQSYTEFAKPQDIQGAYTIYNAYLTLESADSKYSVRLYARNLTDERYFNFITDSPLSGTTLATYAPPRQIGVELNTKF